MKWSTSFLWMLLALAESAHAQYQPPSILHAPSDDGIHTRPSSRSGSRARTR